MTERNAIEAVELTKTFGAFTAVDRLTLHVREGEIFGFLGPNGCGKSTTIRMLCGLLLPSGGSATVAGLEVRTQAEAIRARIGYVAQFFNLYAELTVLENLTFYGGVYGVPRRRLPGVIDAWCERLGLSDLRDRLAGTLSTGYQRTLALAAAVLHEPAVLLLDEPTSGVDPLARRAFFEVIGDLAEQGTSILVTTHVMDEAERCGRLALMNRGRLVAEGTPAELKGRTGARYFSLRATPAARALSLAESDAAVESAALFGEDLQFAMSHFEAGPDELVSRLRAEGITCGEPSPVRPTIEHAFLELLRRDHPATANGGGS